MIKVEDFVVENKMGVPGTTRKNYDALSKLSNTEFKEFHLQLMMRYKESDGWWSTAGTPRCSNCSLIIPGPESLRRLVGMTLDPECFRKLWPEQRRYTKGEARAYFDRISAIV